VYNPSL